MRLRPEYLKLEDIQEMVRSVSRNTGEFYRYYYFAVAMLGAPERGSNLCDIEYDH